MSAQEDFVSADYMPPGPVAAAAYGDYKHRVIGIMGPWGSGKTRMFCAKILTKAAMQRISPIDGKRHYRCAVIRRTYRDLYRTVVRTWLTNLAGGDAGRARKMGTFRDGGHNAPTLHHITLAPETPDGRLLAEIEIEVEFHAIGDTPVEDFMKGFEVTDFFLNEADLLQPEVLSDAEGRCGRFPTIEHGGSVCHQVFVDFNAPNIRNYCWQKFALHRPEKWAFYRQPSGLSPQAENIQNLPEGYYTDLVATHEDWWVRRNIMNEPGYSRAGKPVYPAYKDHLHVSRSKLRPIAELPLEVGMDAGLTPAAVFGQRMPNGQWRILSEIATTKGAGIGPNRFAAMVNQHLAERYPDHKPTGRIGFDGRHEVPIKGWCDPAAEYGADKAGGERSWREIVEKKCGFPIRRACDTNKLVPRLDAVRMPLDRLIDGEPGFLMDPDCTVLREGFSSEYRYRKIKDAEGDRFDEEPDKNDASHPHDALQYLLLGGGEYEAVMERKSLRDQGPRPRMAITDDNPHGVWAPGGRPRTAITE